MENELIKFSGGFSAIIIGLLVGLRHSTDGDHIIAISTLSRDYRNVFKSMWIGVSWGLGHSTPLFILGIIILFVKQSFIDFYIQIAGFFEFGVALMLILLGLNVFWKIHKGSFHSHTHEHEGSKHTHFHGSHNHTGSNFDEHYSKKHWFLPELIPFFRAKSYVIGVVHGLAGSAAVMLLILPTSPNITNGIAFLVLFSLGTMISMALMTIMFSIPLSIFSNSNKVSNLFISVAGLLSIILGFIMGLDITLGIHFTDYL